MVAPPPPTAPMAWAFGFAIGCFAGIAMAGAALIGGGL